MNNLDNYEDIINLPHHTSLNHPRMSMEKRASQFSPFAALTGYEDLVKESARLTDKKIDLDDGVKQILNNKLQIINQNINNKIEVTFTYFVPDKFKSGGKYIDYTGTIKKIDNYNNLIIMDDMTKISITEIINIKSELFSNRNI